MPNIKRTGRILVSAIVTVFSVLLTTAGQTPQTSSMSKFTSEEGGFAVKVPGKPTTKSEEISSENGPSTLYTFLVETDGGKSFYLIGYSDYKTTLDTAKSLNGVINAQVSSMKGKITSDKTMTLKGYPGRSVTIETDDTIFYSSIYVAGKRLYQIMFGMPKGDSMTPEAKQFFDSFEILI